MTGTEEQGPSPTELRLIKVWSKVLGHTNFSLKDNFFSIGGHSLLVNRMQRLIEDEFAVRLPIRTLFSHATVETLADLISTHAPTQEVFEIIVVMIRSLCGLSSFDDIIF